MNQIVTIVIWQSLINLLLVGTSVGVITGFLLIFRPACVESASNFLNKWVSTRRLYKDLERNINIDAYVYNHRFAFGTLLLIGSLYILYFFSVQFDKASVMALGAKYFYRQWILTGWILDASVVSSFLGASLTTIVSLILLIRPNLLLSLDGYANKFFSLRRTLKPLEITHLGLDSTVMQHHVLAGSLLILGNLYTLIVLLVLLLK